MEQPLSVLRDDLTALGFVRDENVVEPEDHVAAMCEVMAMLVSEGSGDTTSDETQSLFFEKHIAPWMGRFFEDLSESESAVFYRAVGRFGSAFMNLEKQYLLV
jgi:TorA maturation chaperone TorD